MLTSAEAPTTGESVTLQNETAENATMLISEGIVDQFIHSVYAVGISGIFVWTALILTSFQVSVTCVHIHTVYWQI